MKPHLGMLVASCLAAFALVIPSPDPSRADNRPRLTPAVVVPADPLVDFTRQLRFVPVFDIMNRSPANKGCVGCHIGPNPAAGVWFGQTIGEVFNTLETGINPRGQQLVRIPVEDGRDGRLGFYLHSGRMPRGGQRWDALDLAILDWWLMLYE